MCMHVINIQADIEILGSVSYWIIMLLHTCISLSLFLSLTQECTRTRPRGWPQPHLPLIAKYDLNFWPPPNISQLREQMGISNGREVVENHRDYEQRKRKLSGEEMTGGSPRKKSRGGRDRKRKGGGASRGNDFEERRRNMDKIFIGTHPALKKKQHSAAGNSSKLLDRRSNSLSDAGSSMNRGSSLLGTPTHNNTWSHDNPHSSSLLLTPVTPPAGLMLPPLRSHSSQSNERIRAGEKRPHHHSLEEYHHHRRDSEPVNVKRPRLTEHRHSLGASIGEDFPREPLFATPPSYRGHTPPQHSSTPYPAPPPPPPRRSYSAVNEQLHYHRDSDRTHFNDQPHSSREMYKDKYHPNSAYQPHPPHTNMVDARDLLNRHMSFNEDHNRGALPPYHRRLSDCSEQSGGIRTPPTNPSDSSRHKRHRTEDGWAVNDRGFRGQPHLLRNNYRH